MSAYGYEVFAEAVAYMEERLELPLQVADIARAVHISESSLQRSFRASAACSVYGYLLQLRLDRAMEYLKNGKRVGAVAEAVGFNDRNHFSYCFKKRFGIPPSRVRKAAREGADGTEHSKVRNDLLGGETANTPPSIQKNETGGK